MTSSNIKAEFTEVHTSPELLPPRPISVSSSEFPIIITESALLEPTVVTEQPLDPKALIKLYDDTFPSPSTYRQFTAQRLGPWMPTLEFKYFDDLYIYHRNTSQTMTNLRKKAQELLIEAENIQRQYRPHRENLEYFVSSLPKSPFQKRLFNPMKVYPRPQGPRIAERPLPTIQKPRPSSSTANPPPYSQTQTALHSRQPRCYQCDSPSHLKWQCHRYRCRTCKKTAPGHPLLKCPMNRAELYDDGIRGYYDIEGDDGNLNGEC
jgi:hypothetical protein